MIRLREHLLREGSTRAVALMRIGLALLVWHRFGAEVAPWADRLTPDRLALAASFFASSTLMLVGAFSRLSTAWTGATLLGMYFAYGLDTDPQWFEHHVYLLCAQVTLLALTPCGGSYSLDRWWAVRRGGCPPERGPLWAVPLIALQTSSVYFWGAWDKTEWAFLSGQRMEHYFAGYLFGSDAPSIPGYSTAMAALATYVVVLEYALAFGLFVRPLRRWLLPLGLMLHAGIYLLIPVKVFSVLMAVLYLAYLDPEGVHRFLDRLQDAPEPGPPPA